MLDYTLLNQALRHQQSNIVLRTLSSELNGGGAMSDYLKADEANDSPSGVSLGDRGTGSPRTGGSANLLFHEGEPPVFHSTTFKDIDNDGDMDIIVNPPNGEQSYWLENSLGKDAHGLFEQTIFTRITPTVIAVGDVDGDGTEDIVVGHLSGARIFLNDGGWSTVNVGVVLDEPRTIILEDLDQDGDTDILIRDSRDLVVILNAEGVFGAFGMTWPNIGDTSLMAVGDLDKRNNALEILTINAETGVLGIISHNGLNWQAIKPVESLTARTIVVADLNHDGMDDVFVIDKEGNKFWLESDGNGKMKLHVEPSENHAADFEPTAGSTVVGSESFAPPTPATVPEGSELTDREPQGTFEIELDIDSFVPFTPSPMPSSPPSIVLPSPPPTELVFNYEATPNLDFDATPDTTGNYSANAAGVIIDLNCGGVFDMSSREAIDYGWDTNMVVNAVGSAHNDYIYGNLHSNFLDGGSGQDLLFGDDGDDTLVGGRGGDLLFGESDDDLIVGQDGDDLIWGGTGQDTLYGGNDNDALFGNSGSDIIIGGRGNDFIDGGSGDDVIHGGMNTDLIHGGSGNDTFHYNSALEGDDIIYDFNAAKDVFEFEFGQHTLHTVDEPYNGDLGIEGEGFVWESTSWYSGKLFYDADTSVTGDEKLIAEVYLVDEDGITIDNIVIN